MKIDKSIITKEFITKYGLYEHQLQSIHEEINKTKNDVIPHSNEQQVQINNKISLKEKEMKNVFAKYIAECKNLEESFRVLNQVSKYFGPNSIPDILKEIWT